MSDSTQQLALFNLMADRIPGVVWATDTDLRFTAAFGAGLAALDLQPNEVVGESLFDFFQTDDETLPPIAAHHRALKGETVDDDLTWQGRSYRLHVEQLSGDAGDVIGCIAFAQDITAQHEAAQEHRRSEAKWQSVAGNAPIFVALLDDADKIQFLNHAVPGMTVGEAIGRSPYDFLQPEYVAIARESITRVRRTGETAFYESVGAGPNGTLAWYETHVSPVVVDDEIVAISLMAVDITYRKQADLNLQKAHNELERRVEERTAELREANQQLQSEVAERRQAEEQLTLFKTFAEASGQGFGIAGMDGNIRYVNPALAALFGEQSPQQAIGKHVSTYYPPDYLDLRETEIFPVVSRAGYWQGELTLISLTGEHIPTIQTSFTLPNEDGRPIARGVVVTDLRETKRVERSLREKLDELQAIYDGVVDGLLIADIETKVFVKSNRAICRMLGYAPHELDSMSVMDIHLQEDLPTVLEVFRSLAEKRLKRFENLPVLRKDGSVFYADITGTLIDYNGRPCEIGFFRDVTERRRAEKALHRMVQAGDRDRELITYEIHDGISQRLAAALMQLEACQQVLKGSSPAAAAAFDAGLKAVREASSEARSLMNRTKTPVLRKFGVAAAIADFIDQFSEERNSPEITYSCEARFKRLEPVLENTILRVAQEAITNACIHSRSKMVRVALIQEDEDLTIEVRDNGVGFDTAKVKENRFGLDSIRERTRLLGKGLRIESKLGRGTLIRATFPLIYRDSP